MCCRKRDCGAWLEQCEYSSDPKLDICPADGLGCPYYEVDSSFTAKKSSLDIYFIHVRYVRNVEQCVFNLVWVGVRIFLDGIYFAFVDTVFSQGRTLVSSRNLRNRICGMFARKHSQGMVEY